MIRWTISLVQTIGRFERYPGRTIVAIGVAFMVAYGLSLVLLRKPNGQIVIGDALEHYVQLRSVVFDHDLQFRNDYAGVRRIDEAALAADVEDRKTTTGHLRNYMTVGPALLWAPLFLAVAAGVKLLNVVGVAYPLDGFGRAFQASAGFSGIFAATFGSWLAFRTASLLFETRTAIWATLTIWLSSSMLYYSFVSPTYSHAPSALAVSAFFFYWIRTRDRQHIGRYLVCGVLVGVCALMRWQDAMLLAVLGVDALAHRRPGGWAALAARLAAASAGAFVAFIPQMAVWMVLYGRPLTLPQGAGFMIWHQPALLAVLFSDYHGLISWTPIAGLAIAGLILLFRRDPLVAAGGAIFLVASWYVNAAVVDWWGGAAFGARRFVSLYPVFVLGLAAVFDRLEDRPRLVSTVSLVFVSLTVLLLIHYQTYMHGLLAGVPYPGGFKGLWLARFWVPFELVASWLKG